MNLDPEMHLWTGNRVLTSVAEAQAELQRFLEMTDVSTWAVVDNASGAMMGRFFICLQHRDGELVAGEGNRIAKPFWRKGHNRDARRLIFRYVFDVLKADCIETECWAQNVNSRESIRSYGFERIETTIAFNAKHGREMEKCSFRLSRRQWEQMTRT